MHPRGAGVSVAELFSSGWIVDGIVVFMLIEWAVVTLVHRRTKRGPGPGAFAVSLCDGLALLLALRASLVGSGWPIMAGWLGAALVAHLWDLKLRWSAARTR
jgi:hypothetical protein